MNLKLHGWERTVELQNKYTHVGYTFIKIKKIVCPISVVSIIFIGSMGQKLFGFDEE